MKKNISIILLVLIYSAMRIWLIHNSNYTAEDAHITFQFARNILRGGGFALNAGDPIYGSTTPLLTLLLTGWLAVSENIIFGARLIAVLAGAGGLYFLWKAIDNKFLAVSIFLPLALSAKLLTEEMQGMEMPLVFLFSCAGWYYAIHKNAPAAGISLGLLLWTRVDTVVFIFCLLLFMAFTDWRVAFRAGLWATAIYLPWVVFAWLYFGSPVPFTVIAKQVAYGIGNPAWNVHLSRIYNYITVPFAVLAAAGTYLAWWDKKYLPFALFILLDTIRMTVTGATFFTRYFHMVLVSVFMLSGFAAWTILSRWKPLLVSVWLVFIFSSIPLLQSEMNSLKGLQENRHRVLMEMGLWLNENSARDATVLLEPLGYVGWYADRTMYDEVGLVTPLAVELHRERTGGHWFYLYFSPDYVIWHCDGGLDARQTISLQYKIVATFDGNTSRSCYDILERISP